MTIPKNNDTDESARSFSPFPIIIVGISVAAIIATFFLANSSLYFLGKINGFAGIIAAYLTICLSLYLRQSRKRRSSDRPEYLSDTDVERGLFALDETNTFFSGCLKSADAFRLVSSRVHDLLPYKLIVLYLQDATRTRLAAAQFDGVGFEGKLIGFGEALAGRCYTSRHVEFERDPAQSFGSVVAVPLCRETEVFGVLQLFFDKSFDPERVDLSIFEAVGMRVSPMMLSSIAFERSQANALTDGTTDLPNERAFYLVLENQVAETQRKPDIRPLTILALDIKNFAEINQRFGHSAGDRVLNFVARTVTDSLRQMDFFARSLNDEFLAVLPTATRSISHDIIARIHTGFFGRKFKINDSESIEIELNIGWAAFGADGETPSQLLRKARVRKDQNKLKVSKKVLSFPHESLH